MNRRVVFDTTTVVSALLFESGRLAWLRFHWQRHCVPLICQETAGELTRVLAYPKFQLDPEDRHELLAEYLPYCKIVELTHGCTVECRDPKDQPILNLAQCGKAHILVSGDNDLLALAGHTSFTIETPEAYSRRIAKEGE